MAFVLDTSRVESIIAYTFRKKDLLVLALTTPHRNDLGEAGVETRDGNKRLALMGDAVIKLVLTEEWYDSGLGHAMLQDTQINYATNVQLCNLATQAGIGNCLNTSPRQADLTIAPATLIQAMKAIIGACWLDCGKDSASTRIPLRNLGVLP